MKTFLLLALMLVSLPAAAADIHPFVRGSWQELLQLHQGQPIVVHLWGLTCGPCLVELPAWGRLQRDNPDMHLVLLDADPVPEETGRLSRILAKAGLSGVESWAFADRFTDRLEFEIDPAWQGELPQTMLIGRDGKVTTMTGTGNIAAVRAWLETQVASKANVRRTIMNLRGFWASVAVAFGMSAAAFGAMPDKGADQPPGFVNLKDGDTVTSPVTVKVSGGPMDGGAMKMKMSDGMEMGAHTHLIVDSPLPAAGKTIPMDAKHVHLMNGKTQAVLRLPPGDHTLQLVVGGADHQIKVPVLASDKITIHVVQKSAAPGH